MVDKTGECLVEFGLIYKYLTMSLRNTLGAAVLAVSAMTGCGGIDAIRWIKDVRARLDDAGDYADAHCQQ